MIMMKIKKKTKDTKKCVTEWQLEFEYYKHWLEATQAKNRINQLEKIKLMWIVSENIINNSWKTVN